MRAILTAVEKPIQSSNWYSVVYIFFSLFSFLVVMACGMDLRVSGGFAVIGGVVAVKVRAEAERRAWAVDGSASVLSERCPRESVSYVALLLSWVAGAGTVIFVGAVSLPVIVVSSALGLAVGFLHLVLFMRSMRALDGEPRYSLGNAGARRRILRNSLALLADACAISVGVLVLLENLV